MGGGLGGGTYVAICGSCQTNINISDIPPALNAYKLSNINDMLKLAIFMVVDLASTKISDRQSILCNSAVTNH